MGRFFIDRPILAISLALLLVVAGMVGILTLPLAQYPNIFAPMVEVSASYPGATADTVKESVATPLEQELNGTPNMVYMQANCSSTGGMALQVTFDVETDPDIAAVDVQNRVKLAESRLPGVVVDQGISVSKKASFLLMTIAIFTESEKYDHAYISNFLTINVLDFLKRVPGVGQVSNMASRYYAMRVWVQPDRLASFGLTVSDLRAAIQEQNTEASVGTIGASPNMGVQVVLPLVARGRLSDPKEFENIILRANLDGSMIRIRDVARVELGSSSYAKSSRYDGEIGVPMGVFLLPGSKANAIEVAGEIRRIMEELSDEFPEGIKYTIAFDSTQFVRAAVEETGKTLVLALAIVLLVVGVLLRSLRGALVAGLAVSATMVGTFALLGFADITINLLSLMALVISVGFLADDAIAFIEKTRRVMTEKALDARHAAEAVWSQCAGTVIATSLVLAAVFNVVGLSGGIPGKLYTEFLRTLSITVLLSAAVTLVVTPALCGVLLGRAPAGDKRREGILVRFYGTVTTGLLRVRILMLLALGGAAAACFWLHQSIPGGFLPTEDQGYVLAEFVLPDGAGFDRTSEVMDRAEKFLLEHPAVDHVLSLKGVSARIGEAESRGHFLIILKPWEERGSPELSAERFMQDAMREFYSIPEALVFLFNPPAIPGLGSGGGFTLMLQDRTGRNYDLMVEAARTLIERGNTHPHLRQMSSNMQPTIPQLRFEVNRDRAKILGIDLKDIYGTMATLMSGSYVNDFNMFNRVYKVYIHADENYRRIPKRVRRFHVQGRGGSMVPIAALADMEYTSGPGAKRRYNMFDAITVMGLPGLDSSSGDAMDAVKELADEILPPGLSYQWSDISQEEREAASRTGPVLLISAVVSLLLLAALLESWTAPIAVFLMLVLVAAGALGGAWFRGLANDIYFQIGLVAAIGLAWKHAIRFFVEAVRRRRDGEARKEAALAAAKQWIPAFLMSSIVYLLVLVPMILAAGPGSVSRAVLGTGTFGGMAASFLFAPVILPSLFALIVFVRPKREGGNHD